MSGETLRRLTTSARGCRRSTRLFSTTTPPPPSRSSSFRLVRNLSLGTAVVASAYTIGALYPHPHFTLFSPRIAPPPPDPDHPDSKAYVAALEEELHSLPLLVEHRKATNPDEWYETRPHMTLPEERRANNLTAGALRGPGRLALPALVRARRDESEGWIFVHVGRGLCGHDGIIHGGLLATLLDEGLARTALMNLPDKIGVTANLSINYKAPTRADQFIVIKTRLVEVKGRKVRVEGDVEDLNGTHLVEASALFVQPKYAKMLSTSTIHKAMGMPPAMQPKAAAEDLLSQPAKA